MRTQGFGALAQQPVGPSGQVLVRTDNTATAAYINRQGGLRSRHMSQLAPHLLLWSPKHLRLFRAIHVSDSTGRPVCVPRDFSLSVFLLPDRGNTRHGRASTQLAAGPLQVCISPVSLLAQTLCKIREDDEQILLVVPYWLTRTWFPELMLLVTAPPWQIPLRKDLLTQRRGTLWHPRPDLWKLHVCSLDGTRRF